MFIYHSIHLLYCSKTT